MCVHTLLLSLYIYLWRYIFILVSVITIFVSYVILYFIYKHRHAYTQNITLYTNHSYPSASGILLCWCSSYFLPEIQMHYLNPLAAQITEMWFKRHSPCLMKSQNSHRAFIIVLRATIESIIIRLPIVFHKHFCHIRKVHYFCNYVRQWKW